MATVTWGIDNFVVFSQLTNRIEVMYFNPVIELGPQTCQRHFCKTDGRMRVVRHDFIDITNGTTLCIQHANFAADTFATNCILYITGFNQ
ncbi:hypothetical protein D3C71_1242410 [compost metagenome]